MERDLDSSAHELLATLPETVVQVDAGLRIEEINHSESPIFLRAPAAGDHLRDVLESAAGELIADLIGRARLLGEAHAEYETRSGSFSVTAKRLKSVPLTALVFQDRTSLRRAEQAVQELARNRSSFLASISHELRTPLTAVLGYANLLAAPDTELDEVARRAMVQDISDQAWDLAGTIEDLLAVARTEIGELRMVSVPVNLAANAAQVIESMGSRGGTITVRGDQTITAAGDPARFRQVVRNLLSNALTHGSEPVTVEVAAADEIAVLSVRDRGPGVREEVAESMFDQYTTGSEHHAPGRVGIGLWLSRELTTMMGGLLTYRREQGETVFEVTVPRML